MALTNNINYYFKHYSFPGVCISGLCAMCAFHGVYILCNNGLLWVEYSDNNTSIIPVLHAFDCVFACFNWKNNKYYTQYTLYI